MNQSTYRFPSVAAAERARRIIHNNSSAIEHKISRSGRMCTITETGDDRFDDGYCLGVVQALGGEETP